MQNNYEERYKWSNHEARRRLMTGEGDLLSFYLPSLAGGGAERVVLNLATHVNDNYGCRVDLVVARREGELVAELDDDIVVHELGTTGLHEDARALSIYVAHRRPAALMATTSRGNMTALISTRFANAPTKTVIRVGNVNSEQRRSSLASKLMLYAMKASYRFADAAIAVSRGVAADLVENFGVSASSLKVVNNPVVLREIAVASREPIEHDWFEGDSDVVLGAGRLTEQKDFQTLVQAFRTIRNRHKAKLVILGEGNRRPELEQLRTYLGLDNVFLPGFVENPYAYMARADVFVLSSVYEGSPNVLVEALACGTPVVATDCPSGPREILDDGRYGPLVPRRDPDALAEAIVSTLADPPESDLLVERASDFSMDEIAEEYVSYLTSL